MQDNPVRGSLRPTITTERSLATQRSFVVRNRARTRSRVRQTSPPPPPPPGQSVGEGGGVFNPFINPALSVLRTTSPAPPTTSTTPALSSSENVSKLSSPASTSGLSSPDRGSRITIPRLKSSSALKENINVDSPETKKLSTKPNIKKENPDTKKKKPKGKRPKGKRPKQKKDNKEKSVRARPPLAAGCFSVCDTLIFEVYQLLGGSVCDC